MDFDKWMKEGMYLPDFMRDFHAQKRVFKRLDEIVRRDEKHKEHFEMPNWVDGHVYVIDFFLWFMARRGYTLQKSHAKQPFLSLEDDLNDFDNRQIEMMKKDFEEMRNGNH